ncbi:galactose-1-epimerase [Rudanella paleaurantiibacter]|uniref:Aldose 1-epimerase n=2 Tax=Rudanella paleaurantiibacter TaxID=2614655 RepID=A0A7J5U5C4_9BACT|nr:galactose-1-epimerase [Rudanella paleaurantiibacter]
MQKIIFPLSVAALLFTTGCGSKNGQSDSTMTDSTANASATSSDSASAIVYQVNNPAAYEGEVNGQAVKLFVLKDGDMTATLSNFGARIVHLIVPDKNGTPTDVSLGFKSLADYRKAKESFFGPVVGRFGNRIAKGQFTLDGKTYQLELNNNGNTLHGGPSGFHNQVWTAKQTGDKSVEMTYVSKDGEGGFPGTVTTKVTFTLENKGLKIDYVATTDKATPYNPTSHGFFNLNGEGSGTVNNHLMQINADRYSVIDAGLIPQGEPASVEGTPFDFRKPTTIGARVDEKNEQLTFAKGYDHNFVLNRKNADELTEACVVTGDKSGITMKVLTTEPAMQFYGGNFFAGQDTGKYGRAINFREGLALEAQHYPDSPNHPTYPSTILKPGQTYRQTTVYQFGK